MKLILLVTATLIAFAANSVLGWVALVDASIDPLSYTTVRVVSAVLALVPMAYLFGGAGQRGTGWAHGSWRSGVALGGYAIAFSFAYLSLSSGTGALILFGAVQVTMLLHGYLNGERLRVFQWVGFCLAVLGIIYLMLPGLEAPDLLGAVLMFGSGVAWGLYSIAGKGARNPLLATSGNFMRAGLLALALCVTMFSKIEISAYGILLAVISGVVTSGMGYAVWYTVLPQLSTTQASVLQLLVPLLAAAGGVVFIGEAVSFRLLMASVMILGGVALSVMISRKSVA